MTSRNSRALRRCQLTTAILSTLLISGVTFAQDNTSNSGSEEGQNSEQTESLDRIVVTGSRIKRSEVEGPSPVTVISTEQLQREGFVTIADTLRTITQNAGSSQNELNSAGGFTPNGSPINLRGLGEGRTLLLINGRRAADYPFPYNGRSNFQNFGNIPTAAVERIEILSGGASAIYGSDAVAGVVNVVLKKNYEGNVLSVRAGTTTEGGGDYTDLQWVGGVTGDNWSLTYAAQYYYDEPVYAYQRDFMDSRDDNPLPPAVLGTQPASALLILRSGIPQGSPNRITPPAGTCERFGGEYVNWQYRALYSNSHPNVALRGTPYVTGETCGYFKDVGYQTINNGNDDFSGYLYGTMQFDNGMELWSSLMGYYSKSELSGGLEFFGGPHTDGVGTRTAAFFATNPSINGNVQVQRIFTPQEYGGLEGTNQKFTEKSLDFAIGLRGTFGEKFDWDLTVGRADYKATRTRPRLDGSEVTNFFLGPILGFNGTTPRYEINLDRWYRPLTPQEYRSMSSILKYEADSYVTQGSFVVSGDLFELPAGPLGMAAVLEYTKQGYDLNSPEGILPTNRTVYNLTGTNGGGDRDRYAVGAEVSIPIFSMLKASLAGRFDKYNDITNVDDAKTWAAGLEFRPVDSLLLRANYSTSFKAPDMHYVYNEGSGSFSTALDTFRCLSTGGTPGTSSCSGATYSYSMFATSKGEPTLEEETGKSLTAGVVWDITDNLSVQADYYSVKLEGAIANFTSTYILDNEAGCRTGLTRTRTPYQFDIGSAFCQEIISRVTREPAPGEPSDRVIGIRSGPVNQSYTRINGIDASVRYRMDTDRFGDFNFALEWSHVLANERQIFATDNIDRDFRDDPNNFDFRSRMRGSVGWQKGDWAANVFMTRYGSLPNWQETARVAPYYLWNVNVAKKITDKATVSFYVNNIFNNFHPDDSGFNSYPYFWRGYSPMGRTISAQYTYKFN